MDIATLAGLLIAMAAILGSELMEGAHLAALFRPSALILVVGGTIGAVVLSFGMKDLSGIGSVLKMVFKDKKRDPLGTIDNLVGYADKARREGLLSLQEAMDAGEDPFLARGLNLVIDGAESDLVRGVMETELISEEKRTHTGAGILETAGGYAPTMGIIGTVMGLVKVLGNLEDSSKLGGAIAVAFLATFYGIFTANILWLPMGAKVKRRAAEDLLIKEIIMEGVLSIQNGENPRILREKLMAFLSPGARSGEESSSGKDESGEGEAGDEIKSKAKATGKARARKAA